MYRWYEVISEIKWMFEKRNTSINYHTHTHITYTTHNQCIIRVSYNTPANTYEALGRTARSMRMFFSQTNAALSDNSSGRSRNDSATSAIPRHRNQTSPSYHRNQGHLNDSNWCTVGVTDSELVHTVASLAVKFNFTSIAPVNKNKLIANISEYTTTHKTPLVPKPK